MKRRAFLRLIGGAAAAWPLGARAQLAMPVVGILSPQPRGPAAHLIDAFRRGLVETGYFDGQSVAIEYHSTEGRIDRLAEVAAELVRRRMDVVATPGSVPAALAAKTATQAIPIAFGVPDDPVKLGLVASLARPGGNATGINFFSSEVLTKRLALLRELLPAAARVAVLVNPANVRTTTSTRTDVEPAARTLGLKVKFYDASTSREIDTAFAVLVRERPDALFVAPDGLFASRRVQLVALTTRHALPASFANRDYVEAGGLMSYGTSIAEMWRQVGVYAGRILKGANPADLPAVQVTKFDLVINLQAARLLGVEVPPMLLARADEVIE